MKLITFSYNQTAVASKNEGNMIEQFKPISFDLDDSSSHKDLELFFRTYVYSMNKFIGLSSRGKKLEADYEGYALNQNYKGMYGIGIDYDDGHYTIDQAHEAFKNYVHIIHTSSSHMLDVPRHGGIQPRFRVILPFEVSKDIPYYFENAVDAELVYSLLKERYATADASVFSEGRKLFPFTGDLKRYIFKLHIPDKPADGLKSIFYTITGKEIDAHQNVLDAKSAKKKKNDKIDRTDIVILRDRQTKKRISDIDKSGTPVFCSFCDDLDSDTASAQINIDKHGNYNMYCHHCNKTYWEKNLNWKPEAEPNLFFDAVVGHVGMYNPVDGHVKYFKNDKDWVNFTTEQGMPKEIFAKLPRANKVVDLKREFGYYEQEGQKLFNIFDKSDFLEDYEIVHKRVKAKTNPSIDLSGLPIHTPTIYRVLQNVLGEEESIKRFINWLAFLIQSRRQSTTAWIIITSPGAGKGVIGELILRPIFGKHAVLVDTGEAIGAQFSSEDAGCWIKVYNEVFTKADFTQNLKRREFLKNRIGTNEILLEAKGIDKVKLKNFVNYLLFSNIENAFVLEALDRRFNVINTLKTSARLDSMDWFPEDNEDFEDDIKSELAAFAKFIQNVRYNSKQANTPLDNAARARLIDFSLEDVDFVISKLNTGQSDYFELETIYPSTTALLGIDPNSDIRTEIAEFIEKYHSIPSKYAVAVFGHFMKNSSRTNIKRKLEQRGILIGQQVWHKETKRNVRCYLHESQVVSLKQKETDLFD